MAKWKEQQSYKHIIYLLVLRHQPCHQPGTCNVQRAAAKQLPWQKHMTSPEFSAAYMSPSMADAMQGSLAERAERDSAAVKSSSRANDLTSSSSRKATTITCTRHTSYLNSSTLCYWGSGQGLAVESHGQGLCDKGPLYPVSDIQESHSC